MIHLAIIENHNFTRDSLINCFAEHPQVQLAHAGKCVLQGFERLSQIEQKPTMLLFDTGFLKQIDSVQISQFKSSHSEMDIVMFDMYGKEEQLFHAFRQGASACISKRSSLTEIKIAMEAVHAGESFMTPGIARRIHAHHASKSPNVKLNLTSLQQNIVSYIKEGMSINKLTEKLDLPINELQREIKNVYSSLHEQTNSNRHLGSI